MFCHISRNSVSMGRIMYSILPSKVKISIFFQWDCQLSLNRDKKIVKLPPMRSKQIKGCGNVKNQNAVFELERLFAIKHLNGKNKLYLLVIYIFFHLKIQYDINARKHENID